MPRGECDSVLQFVPTFDRVFTGVCYTSQLIIFFLSPASWFSSVASEITEAFCLPLVLRAGFDDPSCMCTQGLH